MWVGFRAERTLRNLKEIMLIHGPSLLAPGRRVIIQGRPTKTWVFYVGDWESEENFPIGMQAIKTGPCKELCEYNNGSQTVLGGSNYPG